MEWTAEQLRQAATEYVKHHIFGTGFEPAFGIGELVNNVLISVIAAGQQELLMQMHPLRNKPDWLGITREVSRLE